MQTRYLLLYVSMLMLPGRSDAQVRAFKVPKDLQTYPGYGNASMTANGKTIVASNSGSFFLYTWDSVSGKFEHKLPISNMGGFVLSPDGKLIIASGTRDNVDGLFFFDVATGRESSHIRTPDTLGKPLIAPNRKWIITFGDRSANRGTVSVFQMDAPERKPQRIRITDSNVHDLAISPDSANLAVAHRDRSAWPPLTLVDIESGEEKAKSHRYEEVHALAFHPDRKTLIATVRKNSAYSLVRLDSQTLKEVQRYEDPADTFLRDRHQNKIAVSPDGKWIAETNSAGHKVNLWDANGGRLMGILTGISARCLEFTPDSVSLLMVSETPLLWRLEPFIRKLEPVRVVKAHEREVSGLAICPKGVTLISCDSGSLMARALSRPEESTILLKRDAGKSGSPYNFKSPHFSPDSLLAFTATNTNGDYAVNVYDLERRTLVFSSRREQFTPRWGKFSPTGNQLLVYGEAGPAWRESLPTRGLFTLDTATWKPNGKTWKTEHGDFYDSRLACFLPGGTKIVLNNALFDLEKGKTDVFAQNFRDHATIVVTKDGSKLVGNRYHHASVYDLDDEVITGRTPLDVQRVQDIALDVANLFFVTACEDKTARVWSFPRCELIATLPHTADVLRVVLTSDGNTAITGDQHGQLTFWDLRALRTTKGEKAQVRP